jgi:hypothetical protein
MCMSYYYEFQCTLQYYTKLTFLCWIFNFYLTRKPPQRADFAIETPKRINVSNGEPLEYLYYTPLVLCKQIIPVRKNVDEMCISIYYYIVSMPVTISEISWVMAACRALL